MISFVLSVLRFEVLLLSLFLFPFVWRRSVHGRVLIPWTPFTSEPLQEFQVSDASSAAARILALGASHAPRPFDELLSVVCIVCASEKGTHPPWQNT